jgi:hypothetical protein
VRARRQYDDRIVIVDQISEAFQTAYREPCGNSKADGIYRP